MSEYDIAIKIAGQLEGSFKNAIRGAQQGLTGLGVSGKVGGLALKGVGLAAKATVAGLTAAGTGIAAVGAYSVKVGKEFESQMSTVAAISGATGDDFEALQNKAKEMGATTAFSATEAGQAMEYMSMAGWQTEDMLSGIGGVMNLAAASGEDLASVSDIVTDALTAFGKGADYAETFADQLAAASSNANVNVAMLGESFKYAAPIAGALGFSTADTAEALSLMGNAGIKASQAGTSMRATLNALTASELKFKTASGDVTIATQNADGSMRNLNDILDDSREAFSHMTEAQKAQAAKALVGKNAMSGFLALMNAAPKDLDKVRGALNDCKGAAEEMANTRLDNLEGDITLLKSAAEAFGISVYEHMNKPLRSVAQYGKQQLGILQEALDKGGFEGLTKAIGSVLADGVSKIAEYAPDFINGAADLVESLLDGMDQNSSKIGSSIGRLLTVLGAAIIRLAPKIAVTGVHILAAIGQGIIDNLDVLKDAAIQAVTYLWNAIKDGFKQFKDFLGDESVAPFKKILALLPALVAGFAIFDGIGGAIKGFVSNFKGAGKAMPGAAKGFSKAGSQMGKVAKNILGVGAGLALAAAGIWLLVDAAERIAKAGPGACVALILMVGTITALMVIACTMGNKLKDASPGLLAFGGAILMASGGMAIMSYAAVQLAQAGPMAMVALGIMLGGLIALMAIAGAMGPKLAAAAPGLLAFGGAILMAAGGMVLMALAATMVANAGTGAIITMSIMLVGLIALMVIAAALGPALTAASVGLLAFGAAMLMAGAGMMLLSSAAIQIAAAGPGAGIALALMMVGMIAFGAVAGLLAPILLMGALAIAALGAAFMVVAGAAMLGAAALALITACLPMLCTYGMTGGVAIMMLGASLMVFGAGALVAGAGALVASAGLMALFVAALLAMVPMAAIGLAFLAIGAATAILASSGQVAADALDRLTDYGLGTMASMAALAAALLLPTIPIVALAAAFVAATLGAAAFALCLVGIDLGLALMVGALALAKVALMGINLSIMLFKAQAMTLQTATSIAAAAFTKLSVAVGPAAMALTRLVVPITAAGAASVLLGAGMLGSAGGVMALGASVGLLAIATAAAVLGFNALTKGVQIGLTRTNAIVKASMSQMKTLMVSGMTQIAAVTVVGMALMVKAIKAGSIQMLAIAIVTASGIKQAFSINLYSTGVNMMQGLINGLNAMKDRVIQTAHDIAKSAADTVNNTLQVHSPSRLMMQTGQYTGEGLALGMEGSTSRVAEAASVMTEPVDARSGVFNETLGAASGGNNTTKTNANTFNFNPTYVIQGNADKEVMTQVAQTSKADFESWIEEYFRNKERTAFA